MPPVSVAIGQASTEEASVPSTAWPQLVALERSAASLICRGSMPSVGGRIASHSGRLGAVEAVQGNGVGKRL